jgi:hypothetical protein
MLLADKGLIRPQLKDHLAAQNLDLQTPLRKNMQDSRPKETVSLMMNMRRKVETVIGQLWNALTFKPLKPKTYGICAPKLHVKSWLTLWLLCLIKSKIRISLLH